jgi:O-antigen/teichoic acid export membrane protein
MASASSVLTQALGFLSKVIATRGLGPEGFGIFAVALGLVQIAAVIGMLGLPEAVTRDLAAHPDDAVRRRGALRAALGLGLLGSAVLVIVLWATTELRLFSTLGDSSLHAFHILLLLIPLLCTIELLAAAHRAQGRLWVRLVTLDSGRMALLVGLLACAYVAGLFTVEVDYRPSLS